MYVQSAAPSIDVAMRSGNALSTTIRWQLYHVPSCFRNDQRQNAIVIMARHLAFVRISANHSTHATGSSIHKFKPQSVTVQQPVPCRQLYGLPAWLLKPRNLTLVIWTLAQHQFSPPLVPMFVVVVGIFMVGVVAPLHKLLKTLYRCAH